MADSVVAHGKATIQYWKTRKTYAQGSQRPPFINGQNLNVGYVVAVARNGAPVAVDRNILPQLDKIHAALLEDLAKGEVIYGVNTGFGGSATTRTSKVDDLQHGLVRELRSGMASHTDDSTSSSWLSTDHSMPTTWVRAAIVIRINALINGRSGVRGVIIEQMLDLLRLDIIPHIPILGSISASGDLMPLAYIAAATQGSANAPCAVGSLTGKPATMGAKQAFQQKGRTPKRLAAKETLALVNGTAMSAAVGCLALYEANGLAVLSQVLTAMSVEALKGSQQSFDALFAKARPHPGQIEATANIAAALKGSKLTDMVQKGSSGVLVQDRYAVRTAPQWVGPVLEDLLLAHSQITTECNSVTDNPLIDAKDGSQARYLSGGNFQAKVVTSAMEKVRQSLQSLGRMSFCQATEMINPATNCGLPPNLTIDEPSESHLFKPIDIMCAALLSELGFLANPVGSHVQTAEMGNQSLNSLALISARYTLTAIDLLSKLMAAHLLVACQAIDLRVLTQQFYQTLQPHMNNIIANWSTAFGTNSDAFSKTSGQANLADELMAQIRKSFEASTSVDSAQRFHQIATSLLPVMLSSSVAASGPQPQPFPSLAQATSSWTSEVSTTLQTVFTNVRNDYLLHGDATPYLGHGSKIMYSFIRKTLKIPLLRTELLVGANGEAEADTPTIGTFVAKIYTAIRSGATEEPLGACLDLVDGGDGVVKAKL